MQPFFGVRCAIKKSQGQNQIKISSIAAVGCPYGTLECGKCGRVATQLEKNSATIRMSICITGIKFNHPIKGLNGPPVISNIGQKESQMNVLANTVWTL